MNQSGRSLVAINAALLLGAAFVSEGFRAPRIVLIALVALIATAAATVSISQDSLRSVTDRKVRLAAVPVSVSLFIVQAINYYPADSKLQSGFLWVGCGVVGALALMWAIGINERVAWVGLVSAYGFMMVALVAFTTTTGPEIDVSVFQREGAAALARLENPFTMTFPDIYPAEASSLFYAEGLSVDGVLQFGYPYFPLGLLIVAPFEWVSDYRFALVLAVVASVVLISRLSAGSMAKLAAVVFMLASPSMLMLLVGWMDALVLLAIVLVTYLAMKESAMASAATGLMFAMKQYTAFLLIPSLLLLERPWGWKSIAKHFLSAAAVFLVATLPFALWDLGAFWWSTIELQLIQPFRADSLAIPALFPEVWTSLSPVITVGGSLLVVVAVAVLVAKKAPIGGQGFALGTAAVLLVGFVTSKQAFANYYFVAMGALCAGAAAVPLSSEDAVRQRQAASSDGGG